MNCDARGFGGIKQRNIQGRAGNGIDNLGFVLPVRLKDQFAGEQMHQAAAHGNCNVAQLAPHAGLLERIDAARGNGQIDGAPVARLDAAHVRAPFVEDHREPPLSKRDGKQRPH